jgi:predicted ABC-type ATPase
MQASYHAAEIAAQRRVQLLRDRESFVTETVFSHPSKLEIIDEAKRQGYQVIVMHIGVETSDLSVARVARRVQMGGHDVPEDKIRARYTRGHPLIREAILRADLGWVYDNSPLNANPKRCLIFASGALKEVRPKLPNWILRAYANDLLEAMK